MRYYLFIYFRWVNAWMKFDFLPSEMIYYIARIQAIPLTIKYGCKIVLSINENVIITFKTNPAKKLIHISEWSPFSIKSWTSENQTGFLVFLHIYICLTTSLHLDSKLEFICKNLYRISWVEIWIAFQHKKKSPFREGDGSWTENDLWLHHKRIRRRTPFQTLAHKNTCTHTDFRWNCSNGRRGEFTPINLKIVFRIVAKLLSARGLRYHFAF